MSVPILGVILKGFSSTMPVGPHTITIMSLSGSIFLTCSNPLKYNFIIVDPVFVFVTLQSLNKDIINPFPSGIYILAPLLSVPCCAIVRRVVPFPVLLVVRVIASAASCPPLPKIAARM